MSSKTTPYLISASSAPSTSFFTIGSLNRLASTTMRRPTPLGSPANSGILRREQVSELGSLGFEVAGVLVVRDRNDRHALIDGQTVTFQANQLARIVGDRPDRSQPEIEQDLGANSIIAEIWLEAKPLIGLDSVDALILELIRLELVEETNAPALLIEINNDALAFFGNHFHGGLELPPAITAERVEDVTGQTLRVHPDEHAGIRTNVAQHQGDVLVLVDIISVAEYPPHTRV